MRFTTFLILNIELICATKNKKEKKDIAIESFLSDKYNVACVPKKKIHWIKQPEIKLRNTVVAWL